MRTEEFLEAIRSRTREEWLEFYREKWISSRIWVQEHGERAALAGFVLGIFLVLAFRLVISLVFLLAIGATVVYFLADSKGKPGE